MAPKIAIVYYSMYGHVKSLAHAEAEGIRSAGGDVDIYCVEETLSSEVLAKMHTPPKDPSVAVLSNPSVLEQYDGFLFGIPTRYGSFPAQWRTFWDRKGKQWTAGAYWGKLAGVFVSVATQGGGQGETALATMSTLTHHGIIYVPLGYKPAAALLNDNSEVRGGTPWGAGTFANDDGSRMPSQKELDIARTQGKAFAETLTRFGF
ncbi:Minor allergen Cla h 7 [Cryoendolithus antarcticus]|uniref:Minor allergen Cla h 7 n=1 Tax=Cryoendolithus antarcticus TaxID=1507870 RepID=A0A1V8SB56_9PEZI|nr:Minor allergen Cla h 7 [Cryoendolithus antarcticus]